MMPIETSTIDLHLQPLAQFMADPTVTELVINRPGELLIERGNGWETLAPAQLTYAWCASLGSLLANRAAQSLTEEWPLLGAQMPGDLRVQVVMPPAVKAGTISFTIRRPSDEVFTLPQLIERGVFADTIGEQSLLLSDEERDRIESRLPARERELLEHFKRGDWPAFFASAVPMRKNIVSSGATGSGKTTLGNALAALIPLHERIITVEDTREMRLPHPNQVNLEYKKGENGQSKLKARDLLEASLRMRPDRVLLAELRGDETFFFIQNVLNSGHPGTITTVHAPRAKLAFGRLALLIKASKEGAGLDLADIKSILYALVDIVIQMERMPDGRRVATEVYYDPAFAAHQLG
jgi:type IV secretion system protein VirB11